MDFAKTGVLDASTLKDYLHCPRRYYWRHVRGFSKDGFKAALTFGTAMHAGLETAYRWLQNNPGCAFDKPIILQAKLAARESFARDMPEELLATEALRTAGKLDELLDNYFLKYRRESFTVLSVEEPFSLGVTATGYTTAMFMQDDPTPADGRLFSWVGKMDLISKWPHGISVIDHKTTSQLGQSFGLQWNPEVQMGGYHAVLVTMFSAPEVHGAIINAIQVAKTVSGLFRHPTTRRPDEATAHHQTITTWAERIRTDDIYPQNTTSCTAYGECPYLSLCNRYPNPVGADNVLVEKGYVVEVWNPLERLKEL